MCIGVNAGLPPDTEMKIGRKWYWIAASNTLGGIGGGTYSMGETVASITFPDLTTAVEAIFAP